MASKNLKKLMRKIYAKNKTLNPHDYPGNWPKAIKYVNAKGRSMQFNGLFRPLYKQILSDAMAEHLAGGHKLTYEIKKGLKEYAKQQASETVKAQLAAKTPAQQDHKESQTLLPEG